MTAIHQVVASFAARDATGNHTLGVQRVLKGMGYQSEIYVADAQPEVARLSRSYRSFAGGDDTWLLYQSSTGSPVADWLLGRPERKLVYFHNHTPAALWAPWEPHVAAELRVARRQTRDLASQAELAMANSDFSERELKSLGYRSTTVVPPFMSPTAAAPVVAAPTGVPSTPNKRSGWLFLGRIAPHKGQHLLVAALAVYRRLYDPTARLRLVGTAASANYLDALVKYVAALDLTDAVELTGAVSDEELAASYERAEVFVCASQHEGFGLPALEAMQHGLPVVAVGTAAITEVVGGAGVCLSSSRPATIAAAVHRVVTDVSLREGLAEAGAHRLAAFDARTTERKLAEAVRRVVR
jgi:glycosyltransferase involved in cell wall biosynthesis